MVNYRNQGNTDKNSVHNAQTSALFPQSSIQPGAVVEYLQNNQAQIAWVLDVQSSRLRVFNVNQREMKLPGSRVLPWVGPVYLDSLSRQDILDNLKKHQSRREKLTREIDVLEVWELAQGEITQASIFWFASLIWEEPSIDQIAALGRAMLGAKTHFKFNPPDFEVYSQEVVQKRVEQLRQAALREKLVSLGQDFLKTLWQNVGKQKNVVPPDDPEIREQIKELLLKRIKDPEDRESEKIWKQISRGLPDDPLLPLVLAQEWGILPKHYNYLLDQAEYDWGRSWEDKYAGQIEQIKKKISQDIKEPALSELVSIDSGSTKDIDDAFYVARQDAGFRLKLALACPILGWEFGSELDRAVMHRVSSLYLPEGTSHMLPVELATQTFSLKQGETKPSLLLDFFVDEQGRIVEFKPEFAWIRVQKNLTYSQVEKILVEKQDQMLEQALGLARILRQNRLDKGAVVIEQAEPEIVLQDRDGEIFVDLQDKPFYARAQLIVSEFMILANMAMGLWAMDKSVPFLYRTQDIVLPEQSGGVWTKAEEIYSLVKAMGATITEVTPKPHRSLAVTAYAPITSPLRRYVDFLNLAQTITFLQKNIPLWSKEELEKLLPYLNSRQGAVSQVQRFRPRYWKLVYFQQKAKKMNWTGVVVDKSGPLVVLSLPREQILVRVARNIIGDKVRIGQKFKLRLGRVDPLHNEIKVIGAQEVC
ncbi:RNB domain-containing ribonuclease [Desulfohalobiaceae bacterium Ax17]|uniref:ribonuclease catalytic domain-containing protein n=1 Tax=Desulfovulcanus ferrireducens TaxID=2831190 RepID=UPI00207BCB49|nr:ribonuclease catalytic domain-containing protein [Desulfovulcanus ferrireducens]MBT8763505.1 RNB domain-containing ribonuclease [Desulfovulcanus ferrireducens]